MPRRPILAVLLLLALLCPRAAAWNGPGHMIVAMIAYDELSQTNKPELAALTELLKHHPRYAEDFTKLIPPEIAGTPDEPRWLFAHAATWPDMMRNTRLPKAVRDEFHHSTWHYVNKPLSLRGPDPVKEIDADPAGDPKTRNIVQALKASLVNLKDANADPAARAVSLCWVLHLMGDIHQPLHAASIFSARFPEGDRGGNSIFVTEDAGRSLNPDFDATQELLNNRPAPTTAPSAPMTPPRAFRPELHGFWDNVVLHNESPLPVDMTERRIRSIYPRAVFPRELQHNEPMQILDESFAWAKGTAYSPAILAAVYAQEPQPGAATHALNPIPLNGSYIHTAEIVAESRMALAGYRLADALH